eukprot:TRINITY_DN2011_c0_g2_i1.p1 TRINITY_DN2011_c0_g2~~TRINITY_DN2011_c0_g2_i1.p1  ORF type:complete len:216 (+),score=39.28 TRINITY_DN2011_c0_g2_i1:161-808(+)
MRQREMANLIGVQYADQLKELFGFYAKLNDNEIDREILDTKDVIQLKSFLKFAQRFKIIPHIISHEEAVDIFNVIVKSRPGYGRRGTKALAYEDFMEALVRVCVAGKHCFGVQGAELLEGVDARIFEVFLERVGLVKGGIEKLKLSLKRAQRENDKIMRSKTSLTEINKITYSVAQSVASVKNMNSPFTKVAPGVKEIDDISGSIGEQGSIQGNT